MTPPSEIKGESAMPEDLVAIRAAVQSYLDGLHEGDADKLASVFEDVTKDPAIVKFSEDAGSTVLQGVVKDKARDFYISEGAKFKLLIEKSGATAE